MGKNAILTFSAAALLIIGLILALSPLFKVSSLFGAYESFSPFDLEELTFLKALTIIFYIISVSAILLPIVLNKACKPLYFLPPLFTSLWSVALILVLYIVATGEMDGAESFVSFGLSSSAWFLIIVSLITIAIAVKLMRDLKAAMKNSSSNVLT